MKPKMHKIILIFLCIFFYAQTSFTQNVNWNDDIEYLKTELPKKHINLFFKLSKNDFESKLDHLKASIKDDSRIDVAIRLQQIIIQLNDAHTNLDISSLVDDKNLFPFRIYWFDDGIYVMKSPKSISGILGKKIISINNFPIETIVDSLRTLVVEDNPSSIKTSLAQIIIFAPVLKHFGFTDGVNFKISVEDQNKSVQTFDYNISSEEKERETFIPSTIGLAWKSERSFFRDEYIEEDEIYYVQYNKCWSRELEEEYGSKEKAAKLPSFSDFENKVLTTLREKPVKKFIFDMRFNSGGSSAQGTAFIGKIAKLPIAQTEGSLFVIIGRRTFSSAILNTLDFTRLTKAILVGEETAGKPNHYGELKEMTLPSSGIRMSYSTKYFRQYDKDVNSIVPDIKATSDFEDFSKGIDDCYESIRNYK